MSFGSNSRKRNHSSLRSQLAGFFSLYNTMKFVYYNIYVIKKSKYSNKWILNQTLIINIHEAAGKTGNQFYFTENNK